MKIKYTGNKEKKIVERNGKRYVFTPICEVEDQNMIKWLLSPDRKGLFVAVDENEAEKIEELKCPYCNFVANTKNGLHGHIRFRHQKEV